MSLTLDGGTGNITGLNVETGNLPAGSILQVVQNYVDTTSSVAYTAGTMFDIAISASITPTSSSSKILARIRWNGENNSTSNHEMVFRLKRNGTLIGNAPSAGNRSVGISQLTQGYWDSDANSTQDSTWFEYLDSPNTTSSTTYQLAALSNSFSGTIHTNRTNGDLDNPNYERLTSSITLMEVAG